MKSLYYISLASQGWFLGALVRSRLIKCCPLEEGNKTVSSLDRNKLGRSMAMKTTKGIGVGAGLFVAAMLTASLLAVLYFGWGVLGLPFAPFDAFGWLNRMWPGRRIPLGINSMRTVIRRSRP